MITENELKKEIIEKADKYEDEYLLIKMSEEELTDFVMGFIKQEKQEILNKVEKFREICLCLEYKNQDDIDLFNDFYEELKQKLYEKEI